MLKAKTLFLMHDQISEKLLQFYGAERKILLIESIHDLGRHRHHKKKLVFLLSAMRHFYLKYKDKYNIEYIKTDKSIYDILETYTNLYAIEPGEWFYSEIFHKLNIQILPDVRFMCSSEDFKSFAKGKKKLLMEHFYRFMRKKTGFLMNGEKPMGGEWNFDQYNRKPWPKNMPTPPNPSHYEDSIIIQAIEDVNKYFHSNFGDIHPFWLEVTSEKAEAALDLFLKSRLENFGLYQDAMLSGGDFLFHSGISAYLNIGLLDPYEVCKKAASANKCIQSTEAFIRQILGWREFVRGVYWLHMPEYAHSNYFDHHNPLPSFYWTGDTDMHCVKECVKMTQKMSYSHHIQRLMITGNFANLAKINPQEVSQWYLYVYADAYDWVEKPNTIGMAMYADGGIIGTKPYIAGPNYINKMSNFCKNCAYDPQIKSGSRTCPFRFLYWNFLLENKEKLKNNPRMQIALKNLNKINIEEIKKQSDEFLKKLN